MMLIRGELMTIFYHNEGLGVAGLVVYGLDNLGGAGGPSILVDEFLSGGFVDRQFAFCQLDPGGGIVAHPNIGIAGNVG